MQFFKTEKKKLRKSTEKEKKAPKNTYRKTYFN